MKRLLGTVVVVIGLVAPAAGADPGQWGLTGSGFGSGALAGDHVMIGAHSDAGGADPRGAAESQGAVVGTSFNAGGQIVCLRVSGNRAVATWQLRRPLFVPALGKTFSYAAAWVEDNGEPVHGQPVDRMVDYVVSTPNLEAFCSADPTTFFGEPFATPLQSGNFVVRSG
jgi:hypothetical protein